ncbi:IS110 family RNA-guided transposase [Tessaracoccus caeni]|uniref:IS110 family transposase n=1 Tax=Tessaracoccus caeni TaxID=3031239 RepID=UPI0023DCBC63|nr:IS110 family transposase [Tessaracoccus caeni]MDF1490411.1 IS110 family transposase [Tessaracoccus caeni]
MDVIHPRCCGIDISKTDAKVCIRVQKGARAATEVTTWAAISSSILELGRYLIDQQVSLVVMEATGDYWKPFYFLLTETGVEVMLVNPRHVRQIPGRKTDVADAVWLADLGAHGLVRGSFVPPKPIRELKDLVRARTILIRLRGQEAQRLEKLLESAAIKLSSAISDILGVSGRRMLEAMIGGIDDPSTLAEFAHRGIKATRQELAEALTGRFTEHHGFLARVHLDLIDHYTTQIMAVDTRIQDRFTNHDQGQTSEPGPGELSEARELLSTIPGVSTTTAERVIAEIGIDMSVFPTPNQLVSWAGVAPGINESAGKKKTSRTRPGNKHLKGALGIAALSAIRAKDSFFQARYKRICSRRGHSKALVAIERSMLTAIWHILTHKQPYRDLGANYYAHRRPGIAIRNAINLLRNAGVTVTFPSPTEAVVT